MKEFNPDSMEKHELYKLLTKTVIPRPIAFVTSVSEKSVLNGAPFSYFNVHSAKPPMLSVTVGKRDGEQKDTARNIGSSREFVVHLTTEENVEAFNQASKSLPPEESEIERYGLTAIKSTYVAPLSIKESPVRFECVLEEIIPLVHEGEETGEIFLGRIVAIHVADAVIGDEGPDADLIRPIARLGGTQYAPLGKIFSLKRPK